MKINSNDQKLTQKRIAEKLGCSDSIIKKYQEQKKTCLVLITEKIKRGKRWILKMLL